MRDGWQEKYLGEVCEMIKRGISPKYTKEIGLCVINQKCIRNHEINLSVSRLHDNNLKPVNPERLIRLGDVLINSTGTGTLGRVAQVRKIPNIDCIVDTHVTIVRPLPDLFFKDFFGYALIKIEEEITKSGEGASGQTELSRTKLQNDFKISFPKSLSEQKQVVAILDQAFIAIDQAKANIEKNIENAKELFQSKLNEIFSLEGEGWEEKTLIQIANEFGRGKSKHRPRNDQKLYGGKYPFVQTGDIRNAKKYVNTYSQTYNEVGLQQSRLWNEGTICITIAANIAETAILGFRSCFPDSIIGLVVNSDLADIDYTYYSLQYLKSELQKLGKGSAQDNINLGTFKDLKFPFPGINTQRAIVEELDDLKSKVDRIVEDYQKKILHLEELKKSILQKAFAGELTNRMVEV